jgi:hypothetical protein
VIEPEHIVHIALICDLVGSVPQPDHIVIGTKLYRAAASPSSAHHAAPMSGSTQWPSDLQALSVLTEAGTTIIEGFNGLLKSRNEGEPRDGA